MMTLTSFFITDATVERSCCSDFCFCSDCCCCCSVCCCFGSVCCCFGSVCCCFGSVCCCFGSDCCCFCSVCCCCCSVCCCSDCCFCSCSCPCCWYFGSSVRCCCRGCRLLGFKEVNLVSSSTNVNQNNIEPKGAQKGKKHNKTNNKPELSQYWKICLEVSLRRLTGHRWKFWEGIRLQLICNHDLANLIDDHLLGHHMYADDTQLIEYTTTSNIPNAIMKLQNCVESIHEWCRFRRLQLNPAKTEPIWFGSKASLKKTVHLDLNLYIGADVIKPVAVIRDLRVFLDAELSMDQHVKTVVRSCFFHLRRLKSVRQRSYTRPKGCLPQASIDPLQRVQNAAARLVAGIGTRDHIPPVLKSLHWLPIRLRIQYKLCVPMHQVHIGRSPAYLADMMTATTDLPGRERLRSTNSLRYETPKLKLKFGERAFSYAGPKAWNSLPSNLWELMNTDTFKKQLKTHLFKLAYEWRIWLCWCTTGHLRCKWHCEIMYYYYYYYYFMTFLTHLFMTYIT